MTSPIKPGTSGIPSINRVQRKMANLTSTWNHCAQEMNINAGCRLSPTCLEPAFAYSWSPFLIWLSASENAKSLGRISSSCSKRYGAPGEEAWRLATFCTALYPFLPLTCHEQFCFHNLSYRRSLLAILTIAG